MMRQKRIVLCSDGTGNTANKNRGTNVWKVFEAVDLNGHKEDPGQMQQIAFYDDGVGTEGLKLLRLMAGAVGYGLKRNVKQLYTELCRAYAAGDEVYLFGFSRGAFTVRTLAGLIGRCGIIDTHPVSASGRARTTLKDRELEALVDRAYRHFRKHFRRRWSDRLHRFIPFSSTAEQASSAFRQRYAVKHPDHAPDGVAKIKFVGVWDTVDAVGLPVAELATALNWIWPYKFPDLILGTHVQKGCHALAIDDERRSFHPTMWDESEEDRGENRIEQVWFAGAHANVGGGYPKQGMSLVPLCWMMQKAANQGLRFLAGSLRDYSEHMNVHDKLYDSRAGLAVYYRYEPRDIAKICRENGRIEPKVHVSVLYRTSLGTEGYAPGNLPGWFVGVPFNARNPAPGEHPTYLRQVVRSIGGVTPKNQPLLLDQAGARLWIGARRWAHYALLIGTLAALWLAGGIAAPEPQATLFTKLLYAGASSVPLVGERLYALVAGPELWLLLLGLVMLYLIGRIARRRLARIFSNFWRTVLPSDWHAVATPADTDQAA